MAETSPRRPPKNTVGAIVQRHSSANVSTLSA